MKKLIMTAAVLGSVASIVSAQVYSQNVVGYSKVELQPGFTMMHVPFLNGTNSYNVQDMLDKSVLTKGGNAGAADQIQFWDPNTTSYDAYFLHDGSGKNNGAKTDKWVTSDGTTIADFSVTPGEAFFFTKVGGATVTNTLSGDVVNSGSGSISIVEGFNMVANPFTSDWTLNDGSIDWMAQGALAGGNAGAADQIQLWNPNTTSYEAYFLHDGSGKNNGYKANLWVNSATSDTNAVVPMSQGFFYTRIGGAGSYTISVPQPYNLD